MAIPEHIAIIMDGNGRWAKKRFLTRAAGHRAGAKTLDKISKHAEQLGIKHLTVYAFSTENWKRSPAEIDNLMNLLREYVKKYIDDTKNNNMRVTAMGDLSRLDQDLQNKIAHLVDISKEKTGLNLIIALNYGGRDEIVRATQKMFLDLLKTSKDANTITEALFETYLDSYPACDPQLIIRTSGEYRISNFLLWQSAYAEYYFTEKLWPDFNFQDLQDALSLYQQRERRFGGR